MPVPGGFFLLRDVQPAPFAAMPQPGEYRHVFSYRDSDPGIQQAAVELVRRAKKKIFLASFRIGDKALLNALFEAVERLRGGVYVITAWNEQSLARGLSALEEYAGADIAAQRHRFEQMTKRGIFVRGYDNCHAKFLVVDDSAALVSSANLETSALIDRPERKVTGESGILTTDASEARRLARFFTRMWNADCRWEAPPGQAYALARRRPTISPCRPNPPLDGRAGVIWTHDDERHILRAIHDVMDRARQEVLLATFGLRGLISQPELLHERITAAVERGVKVTLLCRARNNLSSHRDEALALSALGVRVVGDSLNHAKGVIADGRHGALFSANLDGEHGLTSGAEVGMRLDGSPVLAEAERYIRHAIEHADLEFAVSPTQAQLNVRLGAEWRQPWAGPAVAKVDVADQAWRALEAAEPPVLYTQSRGVTRLHAGGGEWALEGSRLTMSRTPQRAFQTRDLMNSWWVRSEAEERRGFCATVLVRQ
ncbi:phosphatidylserine/phosphatidylglycerophosphate/cardiolipin synthase family protein [Actinoplanes bogorensis]|uniref:Phosphatidylserine/phosphatidylglycerophosphate/ cardiolipin synthase family protein n=1 Tax=Paractinoplanes bogorensis TaxID=1610840 RepID=A0ABS5Z3A0_9ACTN|nr:phosphatidylserine/phosphatidylglycerophosphate/cardiolipin synthase family protein [Actinoplanes bogorensis]MBU2670180.1 phosphatidylserine/phosphatidylglycerophosphate/cardiolipin synthase family protein [Actinoplanes bogorensis]